MAREGLDKGTAKARIVAAAAAIVLIAMGAVGTSPAHAQAGESFAAALDPESSAQWPRFTAALDEKSRPVADDAEDGLPGSAFKSATGVSAPLPQAVVTGLVMLAGNWIGTHLWKKRKL